MGLKQKAIRSVAWNTVAKVSADLISIAQLAVVARYIDKADFGLMSTVHVVLGLVMMFSDLGMYAAMMHKQDITENQYSSIYWMNWAINIFLFLVICAIAYPVALFYDESRLVFLIILAGSGALLTPFGKIFYTIKEKRLEFDFISKIRIGISILTFVTTILMCIVGCGIYCLIIPGLISGAVGAAIYSYEGKKLMPIKWHFDITEIRDMIGIGLYNTGTSIFNYICNKLDVLLIGKLFGMETLGLYNIAKVLAMKAVSMIKLMLGSVLAPLLSRFQNNLDALEEKYLQVIRIVSLICFPTLAALCIFSSPTIELFFSSKYSLAAPFVSVLCVWGGFVSVAGFAGQLVIATGRTDVEFRWTIVRFVFTPISIIVASMFSPIAIAWSQVMLQVFFFFIYWRMVIYGTAKISLSHYIGSMLPALCCALLAAIPAFLFHSLVPHGAWVDLIGGCLTYLVFYLSTSWIINKRMFEFMADMVKSFIK